MVAPEALGEYRASDTGNADNGDSNCQYKQHPARCEVATILGAFSKKRSPIKIQFGIRAGQSWEKMMP